MADSSITILELLVDAGPALTEIEKLLSPLERVAAVAQQTAQAVDRLVDPMSSLAESGARAGTGAAAAATGVERLSTAASEQADILVRSNAEAQRAEQALIRQSAASEGTVGTTLKLTKTLAELATAQAEVNARMQQTGSGAIGGTQGTAELAALAERSKQVEAALAALRSGTASVSEAMQRFPEAFASSTNSAGQFLAQLERLDAKLNPTAAAARTLQEGMALLARGEAENIGISTSYAAAREKLAALYDTNAIAAQKAAEATQKLAEAEAARESKQTAAGAQKLREEFDAQAVAIERYEERLIELNKIEAQYPQIANSVAAAREKAAQTLSAQINALTAHEQETTKSAAGLHGLTEETGAFERSGNSARSSVMELEHVFRAMTDSMAAGIPVAQALRFEFPRIVEAVANLGYLGSGGNFLKVIFDPITIGLAAVAAGIYLVGSRALEVESDLRSFGLELSTIANVGGGQTSESLLKLVEDLRNTGSSASEAKAAVDKVLQAAPRGVNPGAADTITFLARDIVAPTGGSALEETKRLADAIGGGTEEFIKYGFAIGGLTAPIATYARALADAGNVEDANQVILQRLQEVYGGAFQRSLSESAKALIEVKASWNELRDTLAKSDLAAFILNEFKGIAEGIRTSVEEIGRIIGVFRDLRSAFHGLAPGEAYAPLPSGSNTTTTLPGGGASASLIAGATEAEAAVLAQIRHREQGSNPDYYALHYPASGQSSSVGSLGDVFAASVLKNSHAFGPYGFQPGTFQGLATSLGINPQDISPANQDQAALLLLRQRGPNAAGSWGASAPPGGYPTAGLLAPTQAQSDAVDKLNRSREQQLSIDSKVGVEQEAERARISAINEANAQSLQGEDRVSFIMGKVAEARDLANQRALTGIRVAHEDAQRTLETAGAYQQNEVAGLRAAAMQKALEEQRRSGVPVETAYKQALETGAAAAVSGASQQIAATAPVLGRQQQLADAALKGTAALNDARIASQAAADTHHALAAAEASGNQQLIEEAARLDAARQAQLRLNEAQQETIALGPVLEQQRNQLQVLQLETTTVGNTSEEQRRQLTILQAQQTFRERFPELAKLDTNQARETYNQFINQSTAIADGTAKLGYQRAAQERLNEAVRSVADTVANDLGQALDNAFSGQKAVSWGETMQNILRDLLKQIVEFTFIQPAIGTALGALGFAQVAQQFGTFSSLAGVLGGSGAAGGVGGAATAGGGILGTLGSAGQGFSTLNTLSSAGNLSGFLPSWLSGGGSSSGGIFGSGGFSGFLNNIGGSLGFGTPLTGTTGVNALSAAELQELGVPAVTPGSLFGSTTLGSALAGAGIGFGAGTLLNTLVGGNKVTGTVGSGLGGLAGAVLGSIVPGIGTLIGGLLGGSGGGLLGGLFGNSKPSGFSSGDLLNLATGASGGFQSSGNAQNDATVNQLTGGLQQFTAQLRQLLPGSVPNESVNLVATTKGIQLNASGELGNIKGTFKTEQEAIDKIELGIAQSLKNTSAALHQVLSQTTDASQITANIQFAQSYDALKKAQDDAFKSIGTDAYQIGPFATALQQLNQTFSDLSAKATQFGLSLDPINAGLAEATRRLQADFGTSLDQALNTAAANDYINSLQNVSKTFAQNTQEAQAIGLGGDGSVGAKIAQLEAQQAGAILGGLSSDQLTKVAQGTDPVLAAMAETVLNLGLVGKGATDSLQSLTTAIKGVEDLTKSLRTGDLSGLPPAQQASAAQAAYQQQLGTVLGAGRNVSAQQLTDLTSLANAAITASTTAYGQGPQTAQLRTSILGQLTQVQGITGPSTAPLISATPGGQITAALLASTGVQAAQANAIVSALHAAGVPGYALGTSSTAPGMIMVGESGPELIMQSGGLAVTPISSHPGWAWRGGGQSSGGTIASDPAILAELQALRAEVVALRKQTQGGQVQALNDAAQQSGYLSSIDQKAGPGVVQPMRQRAGR